MHYLYTTCAGLDVHKKTVVACRGRVGADGAWEKEVRTFGTTTVELLAMADWLSEWAVVQVAMESTGDYWKPIYNLLEGNFAVTLVNAQHVKHVPGRKTDVVDAEWLAQLLAYGLLRASFVPAKPQRALRELTRYRLTLVQERARLVNRVQKLLESANIKLASVASDIFGVSGRAMLTALAEGQSDPSRLAELARGQLRKKIPQLQQALTGVVAEHHRFLLAQQLSHVDFLDEQIDDLSAEIGRHLQQMPPLDSDPPQPSQGDSPAPTDPPAPLTWDEAVALLDTMPGVNQRTAELILAEIGLDMTQFPSADHLASWAGLTPGNHQSGGKRLASRIRKGNRFLSTGLNQAAWAAARSKDTYLAAQYRRLASRRGKKRAIVAVAHSMIVSAFHMLSCRQPYQELGSDYFDRRRQESKVDWFTGQLEKLGYTVHLEPANNLLLSAA